MENIKDNLSVEYNLNLEATCLSQGVYKPCIRFLSYMTQGIKFVKPFLDALLYDQFSLWTNTYCHHLRTCLNEGNWRRFPEVLLIELFRYDIFLYTFSKKLPTFKHECNLNFNLGTGITCLCDFENFLCRSPGDLPYK